MSADRDALVGQAERLIRYPLINAGVFALKADAPHWAGEHGTGPIGAPWAGDFGGSAADLSGAPLTQTYLQGPPGPQDPVGGSSPGGVMKISEISV